ncbi:uncharacterized protein (TIGR00106 family) [Salsuginibacillus halophilus]|uniref:Uncharacterized protein (TIGR00106 family) n=1 Tax=Salsuginibacillus halophilus TaxID=517424 RepID=A0A2P8H7X6_9BACI|nr:MTH1187 family thiamine-binding protein [Salsuginibacillus halophilus]PSL42337.1 uncharacterized protein (TIGR00106 family) [Salsuginibacillus halophilus]
MAIIDLTVVPLGKESMSEDVAKIQQVLEEHSDQVSYELTPMSTIIQGDMDDLFEIVKKLHNVPIDNGAQRVSTTIRIDDRRDKSESMQEKVQKVHDKK